VDLLIPALDLQRMVEVRVEDWPAAADFPQAGLPHFGPLLPKEIANMNQQRHPRTNWGRLLAGPLLIGLCLGLTNSPDVVADVSGPISPQDLEAFFDTTLAEQMAEEHLVGATVAVVQNGTLAFAKGYGYADVDGSVPVQADRTLFYIGSAGKLFTWTAVMQLVEQGKLDLHADVNTYLDFEFCRADHDAPPDDAYRRV
jgi:CubicO group peptidase (beta-lactamase class C family)